MVKNILCPAKELGHCPKTTKLGPRAWGWGDFAVGSTAVFSLRGVTTEQQKPNSPSHPWLNVATRCLPVPLPITFLSLLSQAPQHSLSSVF